MDNSFHYLVMAEHSIFQKRLLAKLKGTGLTSGQPKVLDYLKDHDGATQKDIAHGCHIEPGTLGLVERRMLGSNRRSYYVFMTDLGKSKLKLVTDAFNELEKEAFSGISAEDRENFMDLFQKSYKNTTPL